MNQVKIYVASSWRNPYQQDVVQRLRAEGYEVYDFKNPHEETGFSWTTIDPEWKHWDAGQFERALRSELADCGFIRDMDALEASDAVVLVNPCGTSAHLELGYAVGAGKYTIILYPPREPELMYKMSECRCYDIEDLVGRLNAFRAGFLAATAAVDNGNTDPGDWDDCWSAV